MIAARFGVPALPGHGTAIRSARPLIGQQHILGHEVIDSDHLAIADWWLQTINCEPSRSNLHFSWRG